MTQNFKKDKELVRKKNLVGFLRNLMGGILSILLFCWIMYNLAASDVFVYIEEAFKSIEGLIPIVFYSVLSIMGFFLILCFSFIPIVLIGDFNSEKYAWKTRKNLKSVQKNNHISTKQK